MSSAHNSGSRLRQIERREWWLWLFVLIVTLALTVGIAILALTLLPEQSTEFVSEHERRSVRGLFGLVLIFDIYSFYQQYQIFSVRRQLMAREELFQVLSDNMADMIAVVDERGNRIYNSAAYTRVLGYSVEELQTTAALAQVHPDDLARMEHAAIQARKLGRGDILEYRMRHKDGSWRVLESIASLMPASDGKSGNLVIVNRDVTDRKRMEEQLQHNAFYDVLTGLPNRALFLDRLERALSRTKRHPEYKCVVLLLDIDDFKKVNDSLGHSVGDRILLDIAQRLTQSMRKSDTVARPSREELNAMTSNATLARLGGDEFTILLEDVRDASDGIKAANRIQQILSMIPFVVGEHEVSISAGVGIALGSHSHREAEDLLRDADIAMYRAKSLGRARCEVFDTKMHELAVQRIELESALRKAIERDEFQNVYQPIVRLQDAAIVGFEALARWDRPGFGLLPPAQFIDIAEDSGLLVPINRQLRIKACSKLREWQAQFPSDPPLSLSFNVSARELTYPDLIKEMREALREIGLAPSCLELEILETVAMRGEDSQRVFADAKALGVRLSIDDFGSGFSSLSRLRHLPADTLKIDRLFISRVDSDTGNRAIVHTIVTLAHDFGLKVVAEGAEALQEVNALHALGCDYAQGYYFSSPVSEQAVVHLLQGKQITDSPVDSSLRCTKAIHACM